MRYENPLFVPLWDNVVSSQVASLYDPIDLVTPTNQRGVILFRPAFQGTGDENKAKGEVNITRAQSKKIRKSTLGKEIRGNLRGFL